MHQCWSLEPEDRPPFSSLTANLTTQLAVISDYLTLGEECDDTSSSVHDNTNTLRARLSVRYVSDPTLPKGNSLPGSYGYIDVSSNLGSQSSCGNTPTDSCSIAVVNNDIGSSRGDTPTDSCSIIVANNETQGLKNQPFALVVVDTTDEDISSCGFQWLYTVQL